MKNIFITAVLGILTFSSIAQAQKQAYVSSAVADVVKGPVCYCTVPPQQGTGSTMVIHGGTAEHFYCFPGSSAALCPGGGELLVLSSDPGASEGDPCTFTYSCCYCSGGAVNK
jgi:hypothetical protein